MGKKILVDGDFVDRLPEISNLKYITSMNEKTKLVFTSNFEKGKEAKRKSLKVVFFDQGGDIDNNNFDFVVSNFDDGVAALEYLSGEKEAKVLRGVCAVLIDDKDKYLVIKYDKYDSWELVKGRGDSDETDEETARREIEEEVGISDAKLITRLDAKLDFKMVHEEEIIRKVYPVFLFQVKDPEIELEEKFSEYRFLNFENALEKITWQDQRNAVKTAERYLK